MFSFILGVIIGAVAGINKDKIKAFFDKNKIAD